MSDTLYLSKRTGEDGSTVYAVILRGLPVMADSSDESVARGVLKKTAASIKCPIPLQFWDGDAAEWREDATGVSS